jgi:translation initiation factor IF-3
LALAKEKNLDLAEVAPKTNPPVCKIIDYGKHQYYQKKVETKHRKSQKKAAVKGIRMGFKTGGHDALTKQNQAKKFLEAGNTVKVSLIFRGREVIYKDLAIKKLLEFYAGLEEICTMEAIPKSQGNTLIMLLTPNK